jgi:tetratricopeptide (TPR) repeat protein
MTSAPLPPPLAEPAAEFERHFHWRWWSVVGFLGLMLGLAAVAIATLVVPPRGWRGVPDDPDARAAWNLIAPGLDAGLFDLRLDSELGVYTRPGSRVLPERLRRAERADSLLRSALRRSPADPRLITAIGHLDLVRQRPVHAMRRYQAALDLAPHHDEARLGLGLALARLAEVNADPLDQRRLQLQAIAQLAMVRSQAAVRPAAVFDRAMLLADVGRTREARRWAAVYLAMDPASDWAARLRARLP